MFESSNGGKYENEAVEIYVEKERESGKIYFLPHH
jgi:hypothetical protein